MKRPGFWREAGVALLLSVGGAVGFHVATLVMGNASALRLLVLGAGLAYALALLATVPGRSGRLFAVVALIVADVGLIAFDPALVSWVFVQTFALWLLRCCYFHEGPLAALFDAALCAGAFAAAAVGALHNHSLFLALWAYFLVQALFVLIPQTLGSSPPAMAADPASRFDQAERTAEAALRRLTLRS
jgi:hypothetical protein